eukprot:Hpha_TRINITY_DN15819_c4_g3::TRINITY_DN15819_c4_g3_i1::g.187060::m.187060
MLAPCKHCGHCFSGCGEVCGDCCKNVKEFIHPRDGANRMFVAFAVGMSIAAAAVAGNGLVAQGSECTGATSQWLIAAVGCAVANAIGSIIVHNRFESEMLRQQKEGGASGGKFKKAMEFACYDCGVFFYLLLVIGIMVWWVKAGAHFNDCHSATDALSTTRSIFLAYFIVGPCIAGCSLVREPTRKIETQPGYGGV